MYFSWKIYFFILYTWISITDARTFDENYVKFPELGVSYKFHTKALSWGNARLNCIAQNATLAMPKNKAEFNVIMQIFLLYEAKEITGSTNMDYMFLGFNDFFIEQVFLAESGYSLDYYYHEFGVYEGYVNRHESAGGLRKNKAYADIDKTWNLVYICQKEDHPYRKELKSYLRINRDPNYEPFLFSRKKYKVHIDIKSWGLAQAVCVAEGGRLAIIKNRDEGNFVRDLMNLPKYQLNYGNMRTSAFVGYHDYYVEGRFVTVKGENYESIGYPTWSAGDPNGGIGENCVIFDENGNLKDYNCDIPLRFICEMDMLTIKDSILPGHD